MTDLFAKCETCKHWGTKDCPESALCFSLKSKPFYVPTIGYLKHEPTGYSLAVYKPIPRFKRLMLRWAFGLKYEKIKTKSHENPWCENEL